jgi:hypothetical protein
MDIDGFAVSIQANSEYAGVYEGTQWLGAKLESREGNSPDPRLRSLNQCLVKGSHFPRTPRRSA